MSTDRALIDVVETWLPQIGASPTEAPWVASAVAEQLSGLPTPLRLGVGTLGKALSVLPEGTTAKLSTLPGTGEYVRLVRSLATVVYFDALEANR
ncbi:MAG: hypothetical protein E6Q90_06025 [Actinobacteria bacterium]|nr:MAG: hypothetical protein E6Q90_06025 [Actinomycetota bacterium]